MADRDEMLNELDTAILDLTAKATKTNSAGYSADFARAVALIAEARAWYISPGQPHGGSGQVEVKG